MQKQGQYTNNVKPLRPERLEITGSSEDETGTDFNLGDLSVEGDTITSSTGSINLNSNVCIGGSIGFIPEIINIDQDFIQPGNHTYSIYNLSGTSVSGKLPIPTKPGTIRRIYLNETNGENLIFLFDDNELKSPNGYTLSQKAVLDRQGNSITLQWTGTLWEVINAECCIVDINFIPF